jgi:hypothetical protein
MEIADRGSVPLNLRQRSATPISRGRYPSVRIDSRGTGVMKIWKAWPMVALVFFCLSANAVESGMYRLLSISSSEKLILVSQIPGKSKYLLDAASAKITVNGKAAEFSELKVFSLLQIKMDLKKTTKNGIGLDGVAAEIRINNAEKTK